MSNGKRHFGPTDRDSPIGQSEPPSKLLPNIQVGSNLNGPLSLTLLITTSTPTPSIVKTNLYFKTRKTYLGVILLFFFSLSMKIAQSQFSPRGNRSHTERCFSVGNSHSGPWVKRLVTACNVCSRSFRSRVYPG